MDEDIWEEHRQMAKEELNTWIRYCEGRPERWPSMFRALVDVRQKLVNQGLWLDVPQRLGNETFPVPLNLPSPSAPRESIQSLHNTPPSEIDMRQVCEVPDSPPVQPSRLCADWHQSRQSPPASSDRPKISEDTMSGTSTITEDYLPKPDPELHRQYLVRYYQLDPPASIPKPQFSTHNDDSREKMPPLKTRGKQSQKRATRAGLPRNDCGSSRIKKRSQVSRKFSGQSKPSRIKAMTMGTSQVTTYQGPITRSRARRLLK